VAPTKPRHAAAPGEQKKRKPRSSHYFFRGKVKMKSSVHVMGRGCVGYSFRKEGILSFDAGGGALSITGMGRRGDIQEFASRKGTR